MLADRVARTLYDACDLPDGVPDGAEALLRLGEARAHLLVRPRAAACAGSVQYGRLRLEPAARCAMYDGERLDLSARDFDVLLALLGEPGQPASCGHIAGALAGAYGAAGDNAIDVYVHRLRRKLEPRGLRISTASGVGYALQGDPAGRR
jgi:DNA-binding response OmpR family regulator